MAIIRGRCNILLFHYGAGYVLDRYVHLFIVAEGCANIFFGVLVVVNWAPGVEKFLLRRHLAVIRSAVLVLR